VVSDNLHSTQHGPDSEETQDFSSDDAGGCYLLSIDVANAAQKGLRCCASGHMARGLHECGGVSGCVEDWLEVCLKLSSRTATGQRDHSSRACVCIRWCHFLALKHELP
jgi:hypothetical protein